MSLLNIFSLLLLVVCILLVMSVGDAIVYAWPQSVPTIYWALLDSPVHLALALVVISPLLAHPAISRYLLIWLIVIAIAAVLIDLDHFVMAGSLSLHDAINLSRRPIAHSLAFALGAALVTLLWTRHWIGAALVLGVILSHILRDASHGGIPLFWPFGSNVSLSIPAYYAAQVGIGLMAVWLSGWPARSIWTDWLVHTLWRLGRL